jgi:hypothetical protein
LCRSLAGGYCLRTAAQGVCPYTNICECEHCPNFRSDTGFLPILAAQRADAEALTQDAEARGWVRRPPGTVASSGVWMSS